MIAKEKKVVRPSQNSDLDDLATVRELDDLLTMQGYSPKVAKNLLNWYDPKWRKIVCTKSVFAATLFRGSSEKLLPITAAKLNLPASIREGVNLNFCSKDFQPGKYPKSFL